MWRIARTYRTHNHPVRFWETVIIDADRRIVATAHGATQLEATDNAATIINAVNQSPPPAPANGLPRVGYDNVSFSIIPRAGAEPVRVVGTVIGWDELEGRLTVGNPNWDQVWYPTPGECSVTAEPLNSPPADWDG